MFPNSILCQFFQFCIFYLYVVLNLHDVAVFVFLKCKVCLVVEYAAVYFLYALIADSLSLLSVMADHTVFLYFAMLKHNKANVYHIIHFPYLVLQLALVPICIFHAIKKCSYFLAEV